MDIFGSIKRYKTYRNTMSELNSLNDRELSDIGITRGDIKYLARNVTYR